jgi:hypothetical protein
MIPEVRQLGSARRLQLWLAATLTVNALALYLARGPLPTQVRWGLSFDVAVTVPVLYFLLVVRGRVQPVVTLIPICLVALFRATYVSPGLAWTRPVIGSAAEIAVVTSVVIRVRRGWSTGTGESDILEKFRRAALDVVRVPAVAEAVATEMAIAWYAFCSWGAKPEYPKDAMHFSVNDRSSAGMLLAAIAGLSVIEGAITHALLMRWSVMAAWAVTLLGAYGTIWLIALSRSFRLRPAWLRDDELVLRNGLLWTLRIPLDRIESIATTGDEAGLRMPLATDPNVWLRFSEPLVVLKMYGVRRRVRSVAISVDEREELLTRLRRYENGVTGPRL